MDDQDKIYLWLVVIAFFALLVATAIGWAEITELRSTETGASQAASAPAPAATAAPAPASAAPAK